MLWLALLDHVHLLARSQIDEPEFLFLLNALDDAQVKVVLRVGLPLHVDRVAAQQVTNCLHGPK